MPQILTNKFQLLHQNHSAKKPLVFHLSMKIENKANKVVTEVIKVLDKVSLTDKLETRSISSY